jgi:hypothetical protein
MEGGIPMTKNRTRERFCSRVVVGMAAGRLYFVGVQFNLIQKLHSNIFSFDFKCCMTRRPADLVELVVSVVVIVGKTCRIETVRHRSHAATPHGAHPRKYHDNSTSNPHVTFYSQPRVDIP